MKFRVERDVLAEAVTWVARGVPSRPSVPILAGILVEAADDGTLTLSAFDYEVSARITVSADVEEAGTSLVLGRLLAEIARNLPPRPVEVETSGSKLQLICGSSRFVLMQMPEHEYPTLPSSPEGSGSIEGDVFTKAVAQVSVAADRGDTLPILTGVRLEVEGDTMVLLATDRYRLAIRELHWSPTDAAVSTVLLIPARTLADTAKSLGAAGPITLALGERAGGDGLVGFEAGQRRSTTRLLDGDYPKVASIIPASSESEAVVDTHELVEAVTRVALVAERTAPVRLHFTQGQVVIEAGAGDDAQASEAVEATMHGPDIEVAFNPTFLLDGLGALGTAYTRLAFTAPTKAVLLTGQSEVDAEVDATYRYVLMPVRFAS